MFELVLKRRACPGCAAGMSGTRGGGASLEARVAGGLGRARLERSGLAYAAGFAGVLYLFRFSLAPLAASHAGAGRTLALGLMFAWSLLAPAALALSLAAGNS